MDLLLALKAAVMGLVEGATEFLPISSTGHLILAGDLLNFMSPNQRNVFGIAIQLGAILAVVWEYRSRFYRTFAGLGRDAVANRLIINLSIAFMPLAILGLIFGSQIKALLFKPIPVALAFIVGALFILWAEKRQHSITIQMVDDIKPRDALKLGLAQAVALIPGMSRSGATIIGGLFFGLSRQAAAEFSFFLAVPTLGIASIYSMVKDSAFINVEDIGAWAIGFIFAFISAIFAVRALIRYVSHHDFTIFAWYRIVFGIIVLFTAYTGLVNWSVS